MGSTVLKLIAVGALVTLASLFSVIFDMDDRYVQIRSEPKGLSPENCPQADLGQIEELKPLDSPEEDSLTAEGLTPSPNAEQVPPITPEQNITHAALPAPAKLAPSGEAKLEDEFFLNLHWERVKGSHGYQVKAWQKGENGKTFVLVDSKVPENELEVRPRAKGPVSWQVAAIDAEGKAGPPSELVKVEIKNPETRVPARIPRQR